MVEVIATSRHSTNESDSSLCSKGPKGPLALHTNRGPKNDRYKWGEITVYKWPKHSINEYIDKWVSGVIAPY